MNYEQIPPPDYLKSYIRYFWKLKNDNAHESFKTLGPLPDGCPGIIFQHSSEGSFVDPIHKQLPEIFLYGQTIKPTELYLQGKFQTLGICFYPYALKSIFRFNASELTDNCLDLSLVTNGLKEQLLNSHSLSHQVKIFSSHIYNQIKTKGTSIDRVTEYALTCIAKSKGNLSLKDLQTELQLSERGFQRKFDTHVGISPKLFARVCRFQASLAQLKSNNYKNLSDIAFDNGYADQSHFIRSFKEFAGFSPFQFQKHNRKLAENFSVV